MRFFVRIGEALKLFLNPSEKIAIKERDKLALVGQKSIDFRPPSALLAPPGGVAQSAVCGLLAAEFFLGIHV